MLLAVSRKTYKRGDYGPSSQRCGFLPGCVDKLGSVPFASLIALIIGITGIAVFCGTLYKALEIFLNQILGELFHFQVVWLEVVQVVFLVGAIAMAIFMIILLIFGFLATGATRKNVYSGARCIMGGQLSAAFFLGVTYLMNLIWMCIMSLGVIPIIVYISVSSICTYHVYERKVNNVNFCFDLQNYGIFVNNTRGAIGSGARSSLCQATDLRRLCDRVMSSGELFCVSYVGSILISLAMIHFMIIISSNYTRIKISKELTDYREAVEMEELELHSIVKSKSSIT